MRNTAFIGSFLWAKQDRLEIRCNVDRYSEDGDLHDSLTNPFPLSIMILHLPNIKSTLYAVYIFL